MRSSRATWLTHADTSVTAGRCARSSSSPPCRTGGGAACLAGGDGGEQLAADPAPTVALVDAAGLGQLVERRSAGAGRCRAWPGRAAPGAPAMSIAAASRSRHAATRLGDGPGPRPQRAGVLQLQSRRPRGRSPPVGRVRSSSHASSAQPSAAERGQLGDEAVLQLEQVGARRRRRTPAGSSVSGRRSQSVRRSPLAGVMPELALQQRRPATACRSRRTRRRPGCRTAARGIAPTAWVSTSRSCWAACATATRRAREQPGERRRVDGQRVDEARCRRARRAAPGPGAGSTSARGGTRCRARTAARRPARRRRRRGRPSSVDPAIGSRGLVPARRVVPRPDVRSTASVPPATLTTVDAATSAATYSQARMLRAPARQITYVGPSPRKRVEVVGDRGRAGPARRPGTWPAAYSSGSRTSISRAPSARRSASSSTSISAMGTAPTLPSVAAVGGSEQVGRAC